MSSSSGKGKGKRKAEAGEAKVPLSWAEADRQFYASAAGKAYLTASALAELSTAPSSSAAPTPSVARPSAAHSEQTNVPPKRPTPPVPAPAPLAKKAVKRRFTSEGVEIHHLLTKGARGVSDKHADLQWEALSDAERAQFDRDKARSSASTPAPAPAPSTPSAPEVSSYMNLKELKVLVDLPDEDAEAALTSHIFELKQCELDVSSDLVGGP